ncbi:MAG: hypothetical protein Q9191_002001 [Dirinaria sp. TL-2023a]
MARTFKFSFPLPRRKSSSDKQFSPQSQQTCSDEANEFPLTSPGAKADEILGTSSPTITGLEQKPPWTNSDRLPRRPSFMSVTISVAGSDSVKGEDEVRSRTSTPGDNAQSRPPLPRDPPSSPLLGHSYAAASEDRKSGSIMSSPRARYSPSSSSLQSYYDPAKSPLAVSQQTSASSARDMALRKGLPTVSSPLARDESPRTSPVEVDMRIDQECSEPAKRKPAYIDLSTLFPKPRLNHPAIHSPHLITKEPSQMSLISRNHKSTSGRPKWFGWERKRARPLDVHDSQKLPSVPPPVVEIAPFKVNVVRPTKAANNWFDGVEGGVGLEVGLDSFSSSSRQNDTVKPQSPEPLPTSLKAGYEGLSRDWQNRSRKSSLSNFSQRSVPSQRTASLRLDPNPTPFHSQHGPLPSNSEIQSNRSTASRKSNLSSHDRRDTLSGMDLLNQSVLALSSSEDESDGGTSNEVQVRRHRIRDSIDRADKGEEPVLSSAERVATLRPKPIVNVRTRRRSRSSGSASEVVPPVPALPIRPILNPRVSSMKWQEHTNIRQALDQYADSGTIDFEPPTRSRHGSLLKPDIRGSRIMAVTPEEEKLLEGMRRKRASIRQDNLQESAFKVTSHPREALVRPRTAGADSRAPYFDTEVSKPSPNVPDDLARSLNAPYAASADEPMRDVDYPFPQVPEIPVQLRDPNGSGSPPKQSPSLSFSASDLVPSTPRSRRSPVTPPPGMAHLEAYSGSYAVSPSRSTYPAKAKHERKRTVSSSVVVLDGAEQRAQQLEEEDEITGWAMNRW